MATLILSGSVGAGAKNNPDDVKKVVARFVELGYTWVAGYTKGTENELIRTIKLFQSIYKGEGKADKGDGRIDLRGTTHKWLAAQNAPAWMKVFGQTGPGWVSTTDLRYGADNGGYATSWLLDRLRWAGFTYSSIAFFSVAGAPPLWIRDCSPAKGGNAAGHKSHETGIDVDIRLPLLPPRSKEWIQLDASNYTKLFHFDAAIKQCEAIQSTMDPRYVFFNDPRFIDRGLSTHEPNHSEHYHVRIKPPARLEGVYA